MYKKTAVEIMETWYEGSRIDAIKMLHQNTPLSLIEAKNYLERCDVAVDLIFLVSDFVQTKQDLLAIAQNQLVYLQAHIAQLEFDIANEEAE